MSWRIALALVVLAFASPAHAQTLIATYFQCSPANEGEADFIVQNVFAESYQSRVTSGDLTAWNWVSHDAGGPWRRIVTVTAPTRAAAWDAWNDIYEELQTDHAAALHRFNEICGSHDDYVWSVTASSAAADPNATAAAWLSTYYICNQAAEGRADEILAELSAVLDRQVTAGGLTDWTWYSHNLGGVYRRLLVLSGTDHPSILDAQEALVDELTSDYDDLFTELLSICASHVDYAWSRALP